MMQICGLPSGLRWSRWFILTKFALRLFVTLRGYSHQLSHELSEWRAACSSLEYALTVGYCLEKSNVNKHSQMGVF